MSRPLNEIARDIREDWGTKVNYGAQPYLNAMSRLRNVEENYHHDDGRSIVRYFLANAGTWRGETARKIKLELKTMIL
jgi:hypothetical protein